MLEEKSLIEDFFEKTYEAFINEEMLKYEYSFPEDEVESYVLALISIPYKKFIDYICENYCSNPITSASIPQISNYNDCTTGVIKVLLDNNDPGLECRYIGRELFDDDIERNDGAYTKYGENHVKGAEFHGLTHCIHNRWFLTCLGRIYPSFDEEVKQLLFARTLLRNPFFYIVVSNAINNDVNIYNYMGDLSPATRKRRSSSCIHFLNIILKQCELENISIHDIYYENPLQDYAVVLKNNSKLLRATLSEILYSERVETDFSVSRSLRIFLKELTKLRVERQVKPRDLFKRYNNGDCKAFDILVKSHLKFVVNIAIKLVDNGVPLEDLLQEGAIALIEQIEQYKNDNSENSFLSYASGSLKSAIEKSLYNNYLIFAFSSEKKISVNNKIQKIISCYENKYGDKPSLATVIEKVIENVDSKQVSDDVVEYLYNLPGGLLNTTVYKNDWDDMEDESTSADAELQHEDTRIDVMRCLGCIKPRERDILKMFFGIGTSNNREYTLEEIGAVFDLTSERVRQLKEKALRKMKELYMILKDANKSLNSNETMLAEIDADETDSLLDEETDDIFFEDDILECDDEDELVVLAHTSASIEEDEMPLQTEKTSGSSSVEKVLDRPKVKNRTMECLLVVPFDNLLEGDGVEIPKETASMVIKLMGDQSWDVYDVDVNFEKYVFFSQLIKQTDSTSCEVNYKILWRNQESAHKTMSMIKSHKNYENVGIFVKKNRLEFFIKPIFDDEF